MSSLQSNPAAHPDSSGQLPHNAPVRIPHTNPISHTAPIGPPHPRAIAAGAPTVHPVHAHPGPIAGQPGSGALGARGPPKTKFPRGFGLGGVGHPGFGLGFGFGLGRGGLDNRFLADRNRFGFTHFRGELLAADRARFLAALRGCHFCHVPLLEFIFGINYYPQFANLCTRTPTSCGIWLLGVNGCWFQVTQQEANFVASMGLGGPQPVVIPCGGVGAFPVPGIPPLGIRGRIHRPIHAPFGRGFPLGGGQHGHGFGQGGHGGLGHGAGGIHPGGPSAEQGGGDAGSDIGGGGRPAGA